MNSDWKAQDFERPPIPDDLRRIGDEFIAEKAKLQPDAPFGEYLRWLEAAQHLVARLQHEQNTSSTRSEVREQESQ